MRPRRYFRHECVYFRAVVVRDWRRGRLLRGGASMETGESQSELDPRWIINLGLRHLQKKSPHCHTASAAWISQVIAVLM